MPDKIVTVETAARLHFGPLSWRSEGPVFGGLGLMIEGSGLGHRVRAVRSDEWGVEADDETAGRIQATVESLRAAGLSPTRFVVERGGNSTHRGLGSGTQLTCAVADAAVRLSGGFIETAAETALLTKRGRRSWLGLEGYLGGGLMLDAGQVDNVGVLASRVACPGVVLLSLGGEEGLSGSREEAAFADLPPMTAETTGRLCDLAVRHVIAGAVGGNFRLFAEGLTTYGLIAGEFFKSAQGGRFADPTWEDRLRRIREAVPAAVAQSSWGPAVAVICEDDRAADRVRTVTPEVRYVVAAPVRPFDRQKP